MDRRVGERIKISKPPHRRDVGLVFQNYALFPHLTGHREHCGWPLGPNLREWRDGGDLNTLYVTVGIDTETHGLFAAITPAPEPSGLIILGTALGLLAVRRARSRRRV
jgi:hypothetical protein